MNPGAGGRRVLVCLRWAVLLVTAACLVLPVLLTVLTAYRLVVVDGGSMEPTYAYGDVLLVETELSPKAARAGPCHLQAWGFHTTR